MKAENIIACGVVIIMGISSALMLAAYFNQKQEFDHKLMEAMQDCQRRHMQVVVRGPVVECFT